METRTVMTCMVVKPTCGDVLFGYAKKLLDARAINEFHVWNYTACETDCDWLDRALQHASSDKLLMTTRYEYVDTGLKVSPGGSVTFYVRGPNDGSIRLFSKTHDREACEIVLGGWNNSRSVIRNVCQGAEQSVDSTAGTMNASRWTRVTVKIVIVMNLYIVFVDVGSTENMLYCILKPDVHDTSYCVQVASWDAPVKWWLDETIELQDTRIKMFQPDAKASWTWDAYYSHYARQKKQYENCVLCRCDDSIVYMQLDKFAKFIAARKADRASLLMFPCIINNASMLCYQHEAGLLPKTADDNPHTYFLEHRDAVSARASELPQLALPYQSRVSLQFFAILGKDLDVFSNIKSDEESMLTKYLPQVLGRQNALSYTLLVAKLGTSMQVENGTVDLSILPSYKALLDAQ